MTKLIQALLQEPTGNEPERKVCLRNVFEEQELHPILEHSVRRPEGFQGLIDIFLPTRNVCVEVKDPGRASNPHKAGTGSHINESAYEQVRRYVSAERERVINLLTLSDVERNPVYLGIVTDGHLVWMWEWHKDETEGVPIRNWQNRTMTNASDVIAFVDRLKRQREGKQWIPADPSPIFRPFVSDFETYYTCVKDLESTSTQFHLWKRQLEISGNFPPTVQTEAEKLFVLHTTMIMISRGIAAALNGTIHREGIDTDGFVGWCREQDWVLESSGLIDTIDTYDWISRPIDVLRPLYHGLFDRSYRKLWGEYFTPDWLAEGVVKEVLDRDWLVRQMEFAGTNDRIVSAGVLDPACGSGTFLYHAARRIVEQCDAYGIKTARWKADLAIRLVYGFDIHPVAVEMSKTTLLRALPDVPSFSPQVYQCDSLMTTRTIRDEIRFEADTISVRSRKGTTVLVPLSFVLKHQFLDHLVALVDTAREGKPLPLFVKSENVEEHNRVLNLHSQLTKVIKSEGDDVWAWYIGNQAASTRLAESKVDRIIANPPWVRVSEIQETTRKEEIRKLAMSKKIWSGGKNATGFNIAALFVDHCPALYFDETKQSRCGWVLPWAAMRAENWRAFRDVNRFRLQKLWDVDNLPFPEHSKSCVRFERFNEKNDLKNSCAVRLVKTSKGPIDKEVSWDTVLQLCEWQTFSPNQDVVASEWLDDTGKALVRNGATLFPHCLVRVARHVPHSEVAHEITTVSSKHSPWDSIGPRTGVIPKSWLVDAVYSQDLQPFVLRTTKAVVPIASNGRDFDRDRETVKFWTDANRLYGANRGRGSNTPVNLLDRLNHQGGLTSQLFRCENRRDGDLVVLNASGSTLRAARGTNSMIVEHSLYWLLVDSEEEAMFLTGILNASCLWDAFRLSQKSDRHFDTHFWYRIPIPRYRPENREHKDLVQVVGEAEELAEKTIQEIQRGVTPSKLREQLRVHMLESGLDRQIDRIVSKLMPKHSSLLE